MLFHSAIKLILKNARRISLIRAQSKHETSSKIVKTKISEMVRVLNVAEKNDAARSIAEIMANGSYRRRDGRSVYNKIYEFDYNIFNQRCFMIMTSVSGHLLNLEFAGSYRGWQSCNPVALFEAPVIKQCLQNYQAIKDSLEIEVRKCQYLIIWTDCDREGENIGFEVIEVCKKANPKIIIHRARFSEITNHAIARACANLCRPDEHQNDAVEVRRELDLRIGAAFTRFQTLRLKKVFPEVLSDQLISYGSCQFPTLGFVVERYKQVQSFIPESFWKLKVTHKKEDSVTEFSWKRGRLFDHTACLVLYQLCLERPTAQVTDIKSRPKTKWRPQPLDTVELEKVASRKLHISAKETMTVAEKLYTKGFISYPRTETTIFPKELNLQSLVEMQCEDPNWGAFSRQLLQQGPNPRQGTKTDNAHPPIHPIKYTNSLQGNERTVYEFIVRRFLACLSKDAEGRETTIEIVINDEKFAVNGLMILARNYLDVYPYERWNAKVIAEYRLNESFQPSSIEMNESETSPPSLLTEADLIALMEKHGIGTDATHAEHIETIKSRLYVGVNETGHFVPGELGMGLVEGYDNMGFQMSKPHLRAELEADLKRICDGVKDPNTVLKEQVSKYKEYFIEAVRQAKKIDDSLSTYFNTTPNQIQEADVHPPEFQKVMKCPKCSIGDIILRTKKDNKGFMLSCLTFPQCNAVMWLPEQILDVSVTDQLCEKCHPKRIYKLKFKFKPGSYMPLYEDELVTCLGGCDIDFMETVNVRPIVSSRVHSDSSSIQSFVRNTSSDSGYESANHTSMPFQQNPTEAATTRPQSSFPSVTSFHSPHNTSSSTVNVRNPLKTVSNFSSNINNNSSSNTDVICNCNKTTVLLTVKKEGPNTGRQFYRCPEFSEELKCNFFLWKDEENTTQQPQTSRTTSGFSRSQSDSTLTKANSDTKSSSDPSICHCSKPAKTLTVQKEGQNKGRQFYSCARSMGQSCNYFHWVDGSDMSNNSSTSQNKAPNNWSKRKPTGSNSEGSSKKRRCGLCCEPGHNRKNCPYKR